MKNYQMEKICNNFLQAPNQTSSKVENFVEKYAENDNDDNQSIGKFLSLSDQKKLSQIQQQIQRQEELNSPSEHSQSSQSFSLQKKPKRSLLHNFQKHVVTTLRRNVRLKWSEKDPNFMQAAKEIWSVFRNSKKYTKQFSFVVLGLYMQDNNIELLRKYGLIEIYEKYGANDFKAGQNYLRQKVVGIFRESSTEKIMYERRIQKKKQFASYFYKVMAEIEAGSTKKRLPKKRKMLKKCSSQKK